MKYLILIVLALTTQAQAARYLCTIQVERGYSSLMMETKNAIKTDNTYWYFNEKPNNQVGLKYQVAKANGKGTIQVIDLSNGNVANEGILSCQPTGK